MIELSPFAGHMRVLPANQDAEAALLCSFLLRPMEVGAMCSELADVRTFYIPAHAEIFRVLTRLWIDGSPIEPMLLCNALRNAGKLDEVGGAAFIVQLAQHVPSAANARTYLEAIQEAYALREIIRHSASAIERAYGLDPSAEIIAESQAAISGIAVSRREPKTNKEWALEVLTELQEAMENRHNPKDVLSTGFTGIDRVLGGGLRGDDYVLVTGPTKSGKSILAQNIVENVWRGNSRTCLVFALEMGVKSCVYRAFSSMGRVSMTRMRNGWMNEGDTPRITSAACEFSDCRIFLRDDIRTLAGIVAVSRQMKAKFPDLALIVVDYVQLVQRPMQRGESREQVVADISTTLRGLNMELQVPMLVLAQENKAGEARESQRLEQDCTLRVKIEHVITDAKKGETDAGMRTIAIPLTRNGAPCEFPLTFLGDLSRFENCHESRQ